MPHRLIRTTNTHRPDEHLLSRRKTTARARFTAVSVVSFLCLVGVGVPVALFADDARPTSLLGKFMALVTPQSRAEVLHTPRSAQNLQTMPLLRAALNTEDGNARGGGEITVVDGSALMPEEGPSGTIADIIARPKNATISIYVVREGDTLSGIAELFDVSVNTIMWANDLSRASKLQIGETLTILPVTGIKYTVKSGDTLASVAKKFKGDGDEIANYNGLESDALAVGQEIIIPDGEIAVAVAPKPKSAGGGGSDYSGYYLRPLVGGVRTQGIHGYNGVDLAAPVGTPILAAASGDVIVARDTGWNGGYGQYVVVRHDNGTQTLYAHASSIIVGVGQSVVRGQVIGYVGTSGRSTGPHVHFEIRGGPRNPF